MSPDHSPRIWAALASDAAHLRRALADIDPAVVRRVDRMFATHAPAGVGTDDAAAPAGRHHLLASLWLGARRMLHVGASPARVGTAGQAVTAHTTTIGGAR